jgi:hypothetical protein
MAAIPIPIIDGLTILRNNLGSPCEHMIGPGGLYPDLPDY